MESGVPLSKNVWKAFLQLLVIIVVPGGIIGVIAYQFVLWRKRRQQQLPQKTSESAATGPQSDGI